MYFEKKKKSNFVEYNLQDRKETEYLFNSPIW